MAPRNPKLVIYCARYLLPSPNTIKVLVLHPLREEKQATLPSCFACHGRNVEAREMLCLLLLRYYYSALPLPRYQPMTRA